MTMTMMMMLMMMAATTMLMCTLSVFPTRVAIWSSSLQRILRSGFLSYIIARTQLDRA